MSDRFLERCAIEFERYVAGLHDSVPDNCGVAEARVPWSRHEIQFTQSQIPWLIRAMRTVLLARAWFAQAGPAWAQPLPIGDECVPLSRATGAMYLLGAYAFSLQLRHYDFQTHPSFSTFGRGVMAHPRAPDHVRDDLELQEEFPAKELPGLSARLIWYGEHLPADRLIGKTR
jgi:hypothetical protein